MDILGAAIIRGIESAPKRGTEPPRGQWSSPCNYEGSSNSLFMRGEVARAFSEGHGMELGKIGSPFRLPTSSLVRTFDDGVVSAAATGLHGCTSVVVVSRRGVTGVDDLHSPGALNARQSRRRRNLFDDDAKPRVYIFTPKPLVGAGFRFPDQTERTEDEIRAIFGDYPVPIHAIGYDLPRKADMGGKKGKRRDPDYRTAKGKVLVQYQPPSNYNGRSSWQVWFEGRVHPDSSDQWNRDIT
ncbi:hypothetical protein DL769_007232 [Monosporascus sp. CRB-8-3]|nr:hypothetical protein DL769_007232 [Monosporascus sp. CRB-8-3]